MNNKEGWNSWNSPMGLGLFLVFAAFAALIMHYAGAL